MTALATRRLVQVSSYEAHPQCKSHASAAGSGPSPSSVMTTPLVPTSNLSSASTNASQWKVRARDGGDESPSDVRSGTCKSLHLDVTDSGTSSCASDDEPPAARPPGRHKAASPRSAGGAAGAAAAARADAQRSSAASVAVGAAAAAPAAATSAASLVATDAVEAAPAAPQPRPFRSSQEIFFGRPAAFFAGYPVRRRERYWPAIR